MLLRDRTGFILNNLLVKHGTVGIVLNVSESSKDHFYHVDFSPEHGYLPVWERDLCRI